MKGGVRVHSDWRSERPPFTEGTVPVIAISLVQARRREHRAFGKPSNLAEQRSEPSAKLGVTLETAVIHKKDRQNWIIFLL